MPANRYAILVVEDDDGPRQSIVQTFREDYTVFAARSASEGLSILRRLYDRILVVIVDLRLGDDHRAGVELSRQIREHYAKEVVVFSGYVDDRVRYELKEIGVYAVIEKPDADGLRNAVASAATEANLSSGVRPLPHIPEDTVVRGARAEPVSRGIEVDEDRIVGRVRTSLIVPLIGIAGFVIVALASVTWGNLNGTIQANAEEIDKNEKRRAEIDANHEDRLRRLEDNATKTTTLLEGQARQMEKQNQKLDQILNSLNSIGRDRHRHGRSGGVIEDRDEE